MQLLMIRHGRPHHVAGDSAGADPGLDDLGKLQAMRVGDALASGRYGHVIGLTSSTMRRALETAGPAAEALGLSVATDGRINELDEGSTRYGDGFTEFTSRREAWDAANSGWWDGQNFDPAAFVERTIEGVESALTGAQNSPARASGMCDSAVAVFCHGGVISAYLGHVARTAKPLFLSPDHGSVSRFLVDFDGYREVLSINETAHVHRSAALPGPGSVSEALKRKERSNND